MHIPDGFLDPKTVITTATLSTVGIAFAFRHFKNATTPKQIPLVGLSAAFVFVAQMLNFPVGAGTSGHFMGVGLITAMLGPSAAIMVMSSVLTVQCFLFSDGGLLSLGANIFNMGIAGSLISGAVLYAGSFSPGIQARLVSAALASWSSTVGASIFCAGELAWSGTAEWGSVFIAMTNVHLLIGAAEAVITTFVLYGIFKARPDLVEKRAATPDAKSFGIRIAYAVIILIGAMVFITPFISEMPDGLEKVSEMLGFDNKVLPRPVLTAPLSEYRFALFSSPELSTMAAAVIGFVTVFIVSIFLSRSLISKRK